MRVECDFWDCALSYSFTQYVMYEESYFDTALLLQEPVLKPNLIFQGILCTYLNIAQMGPKLFSAFWGETMMLTRFQMYGRCLLPLWWSSTPCCICRQKHCTSPRNVFLWLTTSATPGGNNIISISISWPVWALCVNEGVGNLPKVMVNPPLKIWLPSCVNPPLSCFCGGMMDVAKLMYLKGIECKLKVDWPTY